MLLLLLAAAAGTLSPPVGAPAPEASPGPQVTRAGSRLPRTGPDARQRIEAAEAKRERRRQVRRRQHIEAAEAKRERRRQVRR